LFEAALSVGADERAGWLRDNCKGDAELYQQVEELLRADQLAGDGRDLTLTLNVGRPSPVFPSLEGKRIGHYEIVREIGRGGMGVVYLARRSDDVFSKHIALKVLRPEKSCPELLRRFRQEREIVATLDHPNIARLLDGGTTDEGLPYSVMEFVEGRPIDLYCDEHRLSIAERLKIFRTVCLAVQFAHQNLVVHRDLKPSNILVTSTGTVKLVDFGIAKLLEADLQETFTNADFGIRPMTPAYASPEQIRGEPITTSSDVYSLGVILYELLTGRWPFRTKSRAMHEVARAICENEPVTPSEIVLQQIEDGTESGKQTTPETLSETREGKPIKLHRQLAGELDSILLMALRKEALRRYGSVEQLSEDLRRHLAGLPIIAQNDTLGYRTTKFVKRHRVGVCFAGLMAMLMSAAVVGTSWQAQVARQERMRAEQQAAEAKFQSARAEREAANAREQLRIAEERTREANARHREADLEREKAARRASQAYSISAALLELSAARPDTSGGRDNAQVVGTAQQIMKELLSEGFKPPKASGSRRPAGPKNLGFEGESESVVK